MQEIEKEIIHQECFIRTLLSCFDQLANQKSDFFSCFLCPLSYKYERDSVNNIGAEKARENLRREKGAEEIRRAS